MPDILHHVLLPSALFILYYSAVSACCFTAGMRAGMDTGLALPQERFERALSTGLVFTGFAPFLIALYTILLLHVLAGQDRLACLAAHGLLLLSMALALLLVRPVRVPVRPAGSWRLPAASALTVLGPRSRRLLLEAGCRTERIIEVQNLQDPSIYHPAPEGGERRWDLLFVGDLIARKRLDHVLWAFSRAFPDGGRRLAVAGDGPEREKLERLARGLGLSGRVDFLGRRQDAACLMRSSRALVLASSMEGLPAAAVEAMYCGLPVILTDVGDVAAQFEHDRESLMVPPGDREALAGAIRSLLTDGELHARLTTGALATRERHMARWGPAGQVRAWDAVLDAALNRA